MSARLCLSISAIYPGTEIPYTAGHDSPLFYLGETSKLIPSMSPLHPVGLPKDLSTPFARYSGWHRWERNALARGRSEGFLLYHEMFRKWDLVILSTLPKSAGKRRGDSRVGPACNKLRDFTMPDCAIAFAIKSMTPIDTIRSWFHCW